MRPGSRLSALAACLLASTLPWLGCGGSGSDLTGPALGTLEVTTVTSGPEPDADGYAVSIDGGTVQAVGSSDVLRRERVAAGAHTVELSGLAPNCTLTGSATRNVTVTADAVAGTTFEVVCGPTTGAIRVTTVGSDPLDEDGYVLLLDGAAREPIAAVATVTLAGLAPGPHMVGLTGVAANCGIEGENPRAVTVVAGATAEVSFTAACAPPPAEAGALEVTTATTGASPDPDGYRFRIDGGDARDIGVSATVTVANLAAGDHSVQLLGVAANCAVGGDNPRTVAVPAGATAATAFAVACAATTGSLALAITGLPGGTDAAVTVMGPGGFTRPVPSSRTLDDLQPGTYTVTAAEVVAGATRYTASPASQSVEVAAGGSASATLTYAPVATTLNLRIDGWHLTQSVQTGANDVPLVTNRDGYLRVFVVASESNRVAPAVRVRFYRNGSLASEVVVPAPGASTPTRREEEPLERSWNVRVPRELIGPGLGVLAEVDPANLIAEQDETDNRFPRSGTPRTPEVRAATTLALRFVPVRQSANGLQGDVSDANRGRYLELTRKLYPLPGTDGDVHAVYTTGTADPLQPDNANGAWATILQELDAVRIVEGTSRPYYGVVRVNYSFGIAGVGFIGAPTAMGYDLESDRARVVAHELGHTWGRAHSPSCGAGDPDAEYPHAGGGIGVYGLDMAQEILKAPTVPDIMGYCGGPWISDYTYRAVQDFRARAGSVEVAAVPQRSLLVWGRIENGRPVLHPAFEVVTRPSLPARPGPYAVEGVGADGGRLFHLSFDATAIADDPGGSRHFAFAVPLGEGGAARLGALRLATPVGEAATVRGAAPVAGVAVPIAAEARRTGGGVTVRWDAGAHPMVMVRDPRTGEVLSLARGGDVDVATGAGELELLVSDGVGSARLLVPVSEP